MKKKIKKLAPASEKPLGSWINHFAGYSDQYAEWYDPERGEPAVMWLAGLHVPCLLLDCACASWFSMFS